MKEAAWRLYMLQCADESLYVGTTTDVDRRFKEHKAGQGGHYTRGRRPVKLLYQENHANRSTAQRREMEIKQWPRSKKLELAKKRRRNGF